MAIIAIVVGITLAVISLVVYSALVVSSHQERLAQRVRAENRFVRAPRYPYTAASRFAFETADELTEDSESETEIDDLVTPGR